MDVHETKEDKFYNFVEILLAFKKGNKKYMTTHICTPAIYCPLIEYVSLLNKLRYVVNHLIRVSKWVGEKS